jgi:hypothetical protein
LLGAGAALVTGITAAKAAVPLDADVTGPMVADDDAELLALVATFRRLHAVKLELGPSGIEAGRFSEMTTAEHAAWNRACEAAGHALRDVFRKEARTPAGILAKLTLWRAAYGARPEVDDPEDEDLSAHDCRFWTDYDVAAEDGELVEDAEWRPWLDTIVADLRTLAGEVRA